MCRYAIRHWLELIRKRTGKSVKHWVITEKGEDYNRIHMHGIVWCRKKDVDTWRYGYTYIGDYVNSKTINYITKYMLKVNEKCREFEGKVFCSQGIGRNYEKSINARRNRYQGERTIETYKAEDGRELPMPKYYHDKIYSEEEREKLWIIKQERGYRYIGGEKCRYFRFECQADNFYRALEIAELKVEKLKAQIDINYETIKIEKL